MSYTDEFIKTIAPIVQKYCKQYGYKFASPIIAQACCESAWGQSWISKEPYYNFFGMKCGSSWTGRSVNAKTKEEYTKGTLTSITANFRAYDSVDEGVKGYFEFIQAKRYSNLKEATSYEDYIEKIKADGYATSSTYIKTIVSIIEKYQLYKYDTEETTNADTIDYDKIALEVIKGKWGNGSERKRRLMQAGYNYAEVQKRVNAYYKK